MKKMKTTGIIRMLLVALVLAGVTMQADALNGKNRRTEKKSVTLKVDTPLIDYISKIYAADLQTEDVYRVQRFLGEVDHVTISFKDEDAADYVLYFKELDKPALEKWMVDKGYLGNEKVISSVEPWMTDADYLAR
jgi:hypothetical protein